MRLGVGQDAQHHNTSIGGSDGLTTLPAVFADARRLDDLAPTDCYPTGLVFPTCDLRAITAGLGGG